MGTLSRVKTNANRFKLVKFALKCEASCLTHKYTQCEVDSPYFHRSGKSGKKSRLHPGVLDCNAQQATIGDSQKFMGNAIYELKSLGRIYLLYLSVAVINSLLYSK